MKAVPEDKKNLKNPEFGLTTKEKCENEHVGGKAFTVSRMARARLLCSSRILYCAQAYIIAHEYRIPAVIGVKNATKVMRTGEVITVDGNKGFARMR